MKTLVLEGASLSVSAESHGRRKSALLALDGLIHETYDRIIEAGATAGVATSGTVYASAVGLSRGDVVSSLRMDVSVGGTGMTLQKVGLYDKNINRLAVSADASTAFNSAGEKIMPMLASFTVTEDDWYYLLELGITGTTMPTYARTNGSASSLRRGFQAGQTDLQATHTLAFSSGTAVAPWMGIS